jgi:hypothetical protein
MASVGQSTRRGFCGVSREFLKGLALALRLRLEACASDLISACLHCQLETDSGGTPVVRSLQTSPGGALRNKSDSPPQLRKVSKQSDQMTGFTYSFESAVHCEVCAVPWTVSQAMHRRAGG